VVVAVVIVVIFVCVGETGLMPKEDGKVRKGLELCLRMALIDDGGDDGPPNGGGGGSGAALAGLAMGLGGTVAAAGEISSCEKPILLARATQGHGGSSRGRIVDGR
jgi:hypothetical protein